VPPQAVLVNGGTASTSEILGSALRADRGAVLVGEPTLGKGRSQRIISITDGSLLLLSTVTYVGADRQPLDGRGLAPDVACAPDAVKSAFYQGGAVAGGALGDDPCVRAALAALHRAS